MASTVAVASPVAVALELWVLGRGGRCAVPVLLSTYGKGLSGSRFGDNGGDGAGGAGGGAGYQGSVCSDMVRVSRLEDRFACVVETGG